MLDNILHNIEVSNQSYELLFDIGEVIKINDYTVDVQMTNKPILHKDCYVIGKALPDLNQVGIICYVGNAKVPCFISEKIGMTSSSGNYNLNNEDKYGKIIVNPYNLPDLSYPTIYTDAQIKQGLENTFTKHSNWYADLIMKPCKDSNINPFVVLGISVQESACGTSGVAVRTFNPGNIGNTGTSERNYGTWEAGWRAIPNLIASKIKKYNVQTIYNLGGLTNDGQLTTEYSVWATKNRYDEIERKHRQNWADNVITYKRQAEGKAK